MRKAIHNVETGEIYEEEMTAEEIAQIESMQQEVPAEVIAIREQVAAKVAAKIAVLSKLGLTEEEVSSLL